MNENEDYGASVEGQDLGDYAEDLIGFRPIDDDTYFTGPGVSRSTLWKGYSKTWKHARAGQDKPSTKALEFGKLIHCAVLEPDLLNVRYAPGADAAKNTKEWKAVAAEIEYAGMTPVSRADWASAISIRNSVEHIRPFTQLRDGGVMEHGAYGKDPITGLVTKCKPDLYNPKYGIILDIKTTQDASPDFMWSVKRYGYHFQDAHYRDTLVLAEQEVNAFLFLVIESENPYAAALYELEPDWIVEGRAIRAKALAGYAQCVETGEWPGYSEQIQQLKMPPSAAVLTEIGSGVEEE
jgi:hypothetical protein